MITSFGLLFLFLVMCLPRAIESLGNQKECNSTSVSYDVFYGWPLSLFCHLNEELLFNIEILTDNNYYNYYNYHEPLDIKIYCTCTIRNLITSKIIFKKRMSHTDLIKSDQGATLLGELTRDSDLRYETILEIENSTLCSKDTITIVPKVYQNFSCAQAIQNSKVINFTAFLGKLSHLFCHGSDMDIYDKVSLGEIEERWIKNCSSLPSKNYDTSENKITIRDINYSDGGFYVCSKSYNSMTRYFNTYRFCIKDEKEPLPAIRCSKDIYTAKKNEKLTIQCTASLGKSSTLRLRIVNKFQKLTQRLPTMNYTTLCEIYLKDSQNFSKGSCQRNLHSSESKCFMYKPSISETTTISTFNLTIKNVQDEDIGEYMSVISDTATNEFAATAFRIIWEEKKTFQLAIGLVIGILVIMIALFFLIWHHLLYFKVYFKRMFGSFVSNIGYDFDVYFSYFSNQISADEKILIKEIISKTRENLKKLGYKRFCDIKSPENFIGGENHHQSMYNFIKISHRIFIVVTSKLYFCDESCQKVLQLALEEAVDGKSKIVFIISKAFIKNFHAEVKQSKLFSNKVIQNSHIIEWPSKSARFFRFSLEEVMPLINPTELRNTN